MRTILFALVAISVSCWHCLPSEGQQSPRRNLARQYFTKWHRYGNDNQYMCKYYFKPVPGQVKYKYQYVVWVRSRPTQVFYLNKKNEYWCAASVNKKDHNKWNVFSRRSIANSSRIGDLPALASFPDDPPPIPETAGKPYEAPMIFPPFEGLPLAAGR